MCVIWKGHKLVSRAATNINIEINSLAFKKAVMEMCMFSKAWRERVQNTEFTRLVKNGVGCDILLNDIK